MQSLLCFFPQPEVFGDFCEVSLASPSSPCISETGHPNEIPGQTKLDIA